MKHINRILMLVFTILLLTGIFDRNNLGFAALFAIPLGFVQLLYCISQGIQWEVLKIKSKYFIGSYLLIVITYFIFWSEVYSIISQTYLANPILFGFPIFLAYSVTAFLELKKFDY
ncbi:hypothetical protein [Tenacibaculum jejuense]|uniref:Uncharacterized protein n=1 Tax=Tenacibaculum jejuense TaxID=584609 RepID=A0A238UE60_9FLAO|nr:hypothetical protein [Tenacibaculum jejuense]SNR16764.1 membrane protein of unknown function [Tenacibaculum jejuense]